MDRAYKVIARQFNLKENAKTANSDIEGVKGWLKKGDREHSSLSGLLLSLFPVFFIPVGFLIGVDADIGNVPPENLVYVLAAVVGGLATYFSSLSSRDFEAGKLRSEWLENLKSEVKSFTGSMTNALFLMMESHERRESEGLDVKDFLIDKVSDEEFKDEARKIMVSFDYLSLVLRRDDESKPENELLNSIGGVNAKFWSACSDAVSVESSEDVENVIDEASELLSSLRSDVTEKTRIYVQEEWREIKRGSFGFRIGRACIFSICTLLVAMFFGYSVSYGQSEDKESLAGYDVLNVYIEVEK